MKLVFTLNPLVAALLPVGIDAKKVVNSCESYRNRMTFVKDDEGNDKEKSSRNLRIAGSKQSGFSARERIQYSAELKGDLNGESNVVARFIAFNDRLTKAQAALAKDEATVSLTQIPLEYSSWLAKHPVVGERAPAGTVAMTPAAGVVDVQPATEQPASNGNGKTRKTRGNRLQPA